MLGSVIYKISIYVPYDLVIHGITAVLSMVLYFLLLLYALIYSLLLVYTSIGCGWIFSPKYGLISVKNIFLKLILML